MTSTSLAGVLVVAGLLGTAASAQAPATPAVYQPGNGVVSPRLVHEVKPGYPPAAMRAGINGLVKMECVVLADGTVGDVQVTQSLAPELDAEAIKSLKMWRFSPGTKDGAPVAVRVEIEMSFTTVRGPRLDSPSVSKPGPGIVSPRVLKHVTPPYPADARAAGVTGVVKLACVVLEDGTVGDVSITQGLTESIDVEAVRTLRQWTFAPGEKDGKAVPVQVEVEMTFNLK